MPKPKYAFFKTATYQHNFLDNPIFTTLHILFKMHFLESQLY